MKRNKLIEAMGKIEDRFILEAARKGKDFLLCQREKMDKILFCKNGSCGLPDSFGCSPECF